MKKIKKISQLELFLKKIMITFYHEEIDFQKEIDFFQLLDVRNTGFITLQDIEAFQT